ncbi:MAG: helix-turn-helix domain-containing protein [Gemmatimonadota bacterium]|nr:helix-turn-helix domain-containing protein [Gemmatimonadota bacterium]
MDKQKILIIGHATYTMSAFVSFLIDGPHEVFTAADGREGLEILRSEQIDLAIAEMYIEDVDGIHFVKRVRAEKVQTDILLRARSGSQDLDLLETSVSVFPIMRDKFLVKIKTSMPSQYPWKTELESFLNEKYCNPELKFDDLMDHFLFCRSYGCKLFKKHLGKTFSEILRETRVAKAQQYLIKEPSLLIYEISDKCGFREQKRLYEAFIKVQGISPTEYRRRNVNQG